MTHEGCSHVCSSLPCAPGQSIDAAAHSGGRWVLFDDEDLTVKSDDEILALSGGGDWHMAYLLLYRAISVPPATASVVITEV